MNKDLYDVLVFLRGYAEESRASTIHLSALVGEGEGTLRDALLRIPVEDYRPPEYDAPRTLPEEGLARALNEPTAFCTRCHRPWTQVICCCDSGNYAGDLHRNGYCVTCCSGAYHGKENSDAR